MTETQTVTVRALADAKRLPVEFLQEIGVTDSPDGHGVLIPYIPETETGPAGRTRLRTALSAGDGSLWCKGDGAILPYGLWRLPEARTEGFLLLVEGESDSWAAWFNGFPCIGVPGSSMTTKLLPVHLADIHELFICREPDEGGQTFTTGVIKRLAEIGYRGRAWVLDMQETFGCKDPAELHVKDPQQFPRLLQEALDALRETVPAFPATGEQATGAEPDQGTATEPARLLADDLETFMLIPTTRKRYLFDKLIPAPSLGMVYGPRGSGKTHFVDGTGYGAAAGDRFLAWFAETAVKTVKVDGEMPVSVQQERFSLQIRAFEKEPPKGYLRVVSAERQGEMGIPDLATREGQKAIESILGDCELLILDNLSSLVRSGVENEGESWLPLQTWLLSLRRRGVSVLLVHHSNKLGDQRGTSRREDCLDYVLSLRRPRDYSPEQGCAFEIHFTKARGLWGKDVRAIHAKFETDPQGTAARWVWSYSDDGLLMDVAELATEGKSLAEIAKILGISKPMAQRRLDKGKREGIYPLK